MIHPISALIGFLLALPPLTGQVLDEKNRPVAGVVLVVTVRPAPDIFQNVGSVTTDAEGRYSVERPSGEFTLSLRWADGWIMRPHRELREIPEGIVRIHRQTRHDVLLLDERGRLLPNVKVALTSGSPGGCVPFGVPLNLVVQTDARGHFMLPAGCPESSFYVQAIGHEDAVTRVSFPCMGDGATVSTSLRLKPCATLSGVLLDAEGKTPLVGALVTALTVQTLRDEGNGEVSYNSGGSALAPIYTKEGDWKWNQSATTDERGRFSMRVLTDAPVGISTPVCDFRMGKDAMRLQPGEHRKVRIVSKVIP